MNQMTQKIKQLVFCVFIVVSDLLFFLQALCTSLGSLKGPIKLACTFVSVLFGRSGKPPLTHEKTKFLNHHFYLEYVYYGL